MTKDQELMYLPLVPEALEKGVGIGEQALIDEQEWNTVRVLHQQGKSKKSIARQLDMDVKTVRRWLAEPWQKQVRRGRPGLLEPFHGFVLERAPEVGYNGIVLLRELRAQSYEGSYTTLRRFMAGLRPSVLEPPTVRFETAPGEQAQVDWGQTTVWIGAEKKKVHIFTMVLGFSRRIYARAYEHERVGALLDGHAAAFAHFGGRTRTLLYDNPRTVVIAKEEATGVITWNRTFKDRMDFYGVKVRLCSYYRAQTKGKVESGVKYVKRNALVGQAFADLAEVNAYLERWCLEVADRRIHGTTHQQPCERFEEESSLLLPIDLRTPTICERSETRRVPRDGYVQVETNRYPVPWAWVGRNVTIRVRVEELTLSPAGIPQRQQDAVDPVAADTAPHAAAPHELVYPRLTGRYQVSLWPAQMPGRGPIPHYLPGGIKRYGITGIVPATAQERHLAAVAEAPRVNPSYLEQVGEVVNRSLSYYEEVAA